MRMKIICFYTGHYAWDAEQLTKSLNKTGWKDFCVENREPRGNWETNTQYKAPFILEKIKNEDSVVWTDADSRMKQYPSLLEELNCDVAFNYMPLEKESFFKLPKHAILTNEIVEQEGFLQSGTMYFNNTEKYVGTVIRSGFFAHNLTICSSRTTVASTTFHGILQPITNPYFADGS